MNTRMSIRSLFLFALLVATGIAGALYLRTTLIADDTARLQPVPDNSAIFAEERAKPRFVGDIGGIFLAPYGTTIPEKFTSYQDLCGSGGSRDVSDESAGVLVLDLDLPEKFVLNAESENTGTVACGDTVYVSRKTYTYSLPGESAEVIIGRSLLNYDEVDVAYDRPRLETVAGRQVVIIDNLTKDGYWQNAQAWFPEPFGSTFISTYNLSNSEFLKLVELVASSTRTQ